ncbi:hypothetical protein QQF64_023710 [Cirrhinus molitorella]|uniref:Uncharacterized protein n=1 Tax=Cirrhinus molitorella TaxID=172907 RepID=A0ABR3NJ47_9TELE
MTTTVSAEDDNAFKSKIAALKAEITLLKDECDFLNKKIEKMKSAVPSAMSQINIPAVPRLSEQQDPWDSINSSSSESSVEVKKKKIRKRKKPSKRSRK